MRAAGFQYMGTRDLLGRQQSGGFLAEAARRRSTDQRRIDSLG